MKNDLVAIVILNYKGLEDTIECVESIKKITYKDFFCVIVDNHSEDGSYENLLKRFPEHVVIGSDKNSGYANGNNLGIKYAIQEGAEYVCILNNDTIVEPNFLTILVEQMKKDNTIGIAGPKICEYFQPEIVQSTGAMINLYMGKTPSLNARMEERKVSDQIIKCDYVGGACLMIKCEMIEKVGLIPECYFLFFEETEWCLRAKKNNYQVVCVPRAKIFHKGSAAIKKISGLSEYYFYRNQVVFEKRNASKIQFITFCIYLLLHLPGKIIFGKNRSIKFKAVIDGFCF